jgi:hypothetical protein
VKPGGVVICIEPDNLSWRSNDSRRELSVADRCLLYEYDLIWNRGHIKQGIGDYTIGAKMLHIMKKVGFRDLDVRLNDMVYFLEPPYDSPVQQSQFKMLKNQVAGKKKDRKSWMDEEKKLYLAGGGNIIKFNRVMRLYDKILTAMKKQVKRREFFRCYAGSFYIAKGTKPG